MLSKMLRLLRLDTLLFHQRPSKPTLHAPRPQSLAVQLAPQAKRKLDTHTKQIPTATTTTHSESMFSIIAYIAAQQQLLLDVSRLRQGG